VAGRIDFIDLGAQRARIGRRMEEAILRVVAEGNYILGPQVAELEKRLAAFCGARRALACANGTDAIGLALMALKLRPGDAVLVPSFAFAAAAEAVAWLGATPVFADIEDRHYNIDPAGLEGVHAAALKAGLKPRALIAVDLFGHPADYDAIEPFCRAHGLALIADAAQSFGCAYRGRRAGAIGDFATTSFYPAKPLGCYGDGGAVFTADDAHAEAIASLKVHGQGGDKYDNVRIGVNSRLDTIQAAVLLEKLAVYEEEIEARQRVAARYAEGLAEAAVIPEVMEGCVSVWAQYTIRVPAGARDGFVAALKAEGVPTAIHYPKPLHRQAAYSRFPQAEGGLPVSERVAGEVVSLPMHAYLDAATQDRIIDAARRALGRRAVAAE